MVLKRTAEDLLHPERIIFRLVNDYTEGRLNPDGRWLYRAVVLDVDTEGGKLESSPPNPPGSIRARIYTRGLDATTPNSALTIFHPFFPYHIAPPVERDEHVYVVFEDESKSNGLWITTIPVHRDVNFKDPEEARGSTPTAANTFEGTSPETTTPNRDAEFGGLAEQSAIRNETVSIYAGDQQSFFKDKKILHIGDSQVAGPYGRELGTIARERGGEYVRDGRVGWGVGGWLAGNINGRRGHASRPKVDELINRHNPDVILITLGGNDHQRSANESYPDKVRTLYDLASQGGQVIWVTPPTAVGRSRNIQPGRDRVAEIIKSIVGASYIDSRDFTGEGGRARDGVHFGPRGGRRFAESVASRLENNF